MFANFETHTVEQEPLLKRFLVPKQGLRPGKPRLHCVQLDWGGRQKHLRAAGSALRDAWRTGQEIRASDDVVLFPNSVYGADASVIYAPEYGGRAFRLRDRGYDATLERYATKRVGFNVRTKSNASGLRLTILEINGDACVIMEST